jgi:hypothetical protein
VDCTLDFSVHALKVVFSRWLVAVNCGLQYKSISLFVGTWNMNNTCSLQEVKGDVQRIIANLSRQELLVW